MGWARPGHERRYGFIAPREVAMNELQRR